MVFSAEKGEDGREENKRGDKMEGGEQIGEKRKQSLLSSCGVFFYQLHISNG